MLAPIHPETAAFGAFKTTLTTANLPTLDLLDAGGMYFAHAEGERALGYVGLVRLGDEGLLRSLLVLPNVRGRGIGAAMVAALAVIAQREGVQRLWLLTTNADDFFAGCDFRRVERADAPLAIATSRQFSGICPGSAVLMCRNLA